MNKNLFLVLLALVFSVAAFAQDVDITSKKIKVRYKKAKKIDFESLLVEGENKKPDYAVVTGNLGEKDLGLLQLRTNFNDFMANDAGEEIK